MNIIEQFKNRPIHIDRMVFPKKQRLPRKLKKEARKGNKRILVYFDGKPLFLGTLL